MSKFDYAALGDYETDVAKTIVKHIGKNPQKTEMYVEVVAKLLPNSFQSSPDFVQVLLTELHAL